MNKALFFFLSSFALALPQPCLAINGSLEIRGPEGQQEVWLKNLPDAPPEVKVGRLYRLPAGTSLFHWGDPSADDRAAIEQLHTLPPGFLDKQLGKDQASPFGQKHGGGFYVSTNLTDTQKYGGSLTASSLPSDALVLGDGNDSASQRAGHGWNELIPELRKIGVAAIDDPQDGATVWLNVISNDAMKDLHFVNTPELRTRMGETLFLNLPGSNFEAVTKKFPDLLADPATAAMADKAKALQAAVSIPGPAQIPTLQEIASRGDLQLKGWALGQIQWEKLPAPFPAALAETLLQDPSSAVRQKTLMFFANAVRDDGKNKEAIEKVLNYGLRDSDPILRILTATLLGMVMQNPALAPTAQAVVNAGAYDGADATLAHLLPPKTAAACPQGFQAIAPLSHP